MRVDHTDLSTGTMSYSQSSNRKLKIDFYSANWVVSLFSLVRNIVLTWRVLYLENFKPSESDFTDKPARDDSLTNI